MLKFTKKSRTYKYLWCFLRLPSNLIPWTSARSRYFTKWNWELLMQVHHTVSRETALLKALQQPKPAIHSVSASAFTYSSVSHDLIIPVCLIANWATAWKSAIVGFPDGKCFTFYIKKILWENNMVKNVNQVISTISLR